MTDSGINFSYLIFLSIATPLFIRSIYFLGFFSNVFKAG